MRPVNGSLSSPHVFCSSWHGTSGRSGDDFRCLCQHLATGSSNMKIDADEDEDHGFSVLTEIILKFLHLVLISVSRNVWKLHQTSWWVYVPPSFCCKTTCSPRDSSWNFSSLLLIFSGILWMFTWPLRVIQAAANDTLPRSLPGALEACRRAGSELDDKLQGERKAVRASPMAGPSLSGIKRGCTSSCSMAPMAQEYLYTSLEAVLLIPPSVAVVSIPHHRIMSSTGTEAHTTHLKHRQFFASLYRRLVWFEDVLYTAGLV